MTLVAAFIGTITGFGTSTVLVPVLSLKFPFTQTLLFVGIIHLFGDIWKMVFFKKGINWRLILLFGLPGMVMSFVSAKMVTGIAPEILERLLGIFLVLYVLFIFYKPGWKLRENNLTAVSGGVLSGFFQGLFGVGGAIRSLFLTTFDLNKSIFIFTSGAIGFLVDSSRLISYRQSGINLDDFGWTLLVISVILSLTAAYLAKKTVSFIPQNKFRTLVAVFLLLVGIRYLVI